MQKIIMLAKPCCDHVEGFESGLKAQEVDVGEWERASGTALADAFKYTVMMNIGQLCCNGVIFLENLEHLRPCQLKMEQVRMMTSGCKSTLSKKAKGRAKANTKTRKDVAQAIPATQTSKLGRHVVERDIG